MTSSAALQRALMMENYPTNTTSGGGNYTSETLTFTGDLITDAVRAAGVEGDGLTPPAGVGVWPAATNLVTNGGFETNTTGWVGTRATLARSTVQSKFGAASMLVTATDLFAYGTFTLSGLANGEYVLSFWQRQGPQAATDGFYAVNDGTTTFAEAAYTPTADWSRVIVPFTVTGSPANVFVSLYSRFAGGAVGDQVYLDGIQVETGSIATPYIETDGGTASRVAGRVQQPVSGLFTATQGAVVARLKMGFAATGNPYAGSFPAIFTWRDGGSAEISVQYDIANDKFGIVRRAAGATRVNETNAQTFAVGDSVTVATTWTATTLKATSDADAFNSGADTNVPTISATSADVGSFGTAQQIASNVLWFATFAGTLTNADSAALNAFGDTPPTWAQIKGALPAAAQLTSLWPAVTNAYQKVVP